MFEVYLSNRNDRNCNSGKQMRYVNSLRESFMLRHALTEQQVQHYNKEGFLIVNSILTASDLTEIDHAIREMTDRALDGGEMSQILELEPEPVDGKRVLRRIQQPFDQHETFRKVATNPRILDPIESLIGANFNLQHS